MPVSPDEFVDLVQDHLDGLASPETTALLQAHPKAWAAALLRLLDAVDLAIERLEQTLKGRERSMVLADFEREYQRIDELLTELIGPPTERSGSAPTRPTEPAPSIPEAGLTQLQLSWSPGKVVAWAAGHEAPSGSESEVRERLAAAGAGTIDWESHHSIKVPGQGRADAVSAPIEACLGWLVALSTTAEDDTTGPSVAWIGQVTELAVRLAAQGRAVPQIKKSRRPRHQGSGDGGAPKRNGADAASVFEVRWVPALVDPDEHNELSQALPGTVSVLENRPDSRAMTSAVLADLVTAIFSEAAGRLEVPAAPPDPSTKGDVAECFLTRLDGKPFVAPGRLGSELARRVDQWTRSVSGTKKFKLVIQLDPPDESNAWYLAVLAPNNDNRLLPVEQVMVNSSNTRRKEVEEELVRLERLFPELLRPGARRRGEVVLSQDEAWRLMSRDGSVLAAAGFEVRAPMLSRRKPTPTLRLTSEEAQESVVGAQQLANVRWSVTFDDIELSADEIAELASQARPLVESHGRWVELDQADLAQAAAALARSA